MSSLLKQAIIDANLLKESAEKQAEKAILEKYSSEIKDVYESMLEVAPDPLADMAGEKSAQRDFDFEDDLDFDGDSMDAQIPYSFADGEAMMGAPDQEEEIEIDFDKLAAMLGDVEPDSEIEEPLDLGLMGDEDTQDMELPTELGNDEEDMMGLKEAEKFKFQSKAMGNAPEDRLKNISPNVKDKDVKKATKNVLNPLDEPDVIDVKEANAPVCEMCGKKHMGEGCSKMKESEEHSPEEEDSLDLSSIPDENVDAHIQARIDKAYEDYTEYTNAASAYKKYPEHFPNGPTGAIKHFQKKADEARKEYIRLNLILRNRQTVAAGGEPEDDIQASKPAWMKEEERFKKTSSEVPWSPDSAKDGVMSKAQRHKGDPLDRSRHADVNWSKDDPRHKRFSSPDLEEKVVIDDTGNKSGWTSRATDILSHELDKKAAHDKFDKTDGEEFKDGDYKKDLEKKDTEYDSLKEEYNILKKNFKEIFKENSNLKEQNNNYEVRIDELSEKNKQFLSLLERAQNELQENQIKMTKLFYENKVFRDASLNERQKNNIVEVISDINTVEQIKPVYEALLRTKGTITQKGESSNSLQEALKNRPRVARMAAATEVSGESKEQQVKNDPLTERMQKLAGIKK